MAVSGTLSGAAAFVRKRISLLKIWEEYCIVDLLKAEEENGGLIRETKLEIFCGMRNKIQLLYIFDFK